jgi:hypothetical protein
MATEHKREQPIVWQHLQYPIPWAATPTPWYTPVGFREADADARTPGATGARNASSTPAHDRFDAVEPANAA